MRVLNKQELALIAILAHPQIARNALRMTADHIDLFSRIQSPHVNLMWESYLKLRVKNKGKKIGNAVLKSELAEAIASDMDMPPELVERCDYILDKFDKGEDIPSLEDSAELLQTMVHGDLNRKLSRLIGDDAAISEMAKAVNQASGAVSELGNELEEDNRYVFNPFKEIDKFAIHTTRLPTGINWMDELTSGGGRGGEMWLILGPPAGGKCLHPDTPVLMYDGTIRKAKEIAIGDQLMGPDSKPRNVLQLGCGRSKMYRIIPKKGDSYIVNKYHILTLVAMPNHGKNMVYKGRIYRKGDLIDIPVEDYINLAKSKKARLKGVRTGVDFKDTDIPLDPYFVGLYLGDGSRRKAQLTLSDKVLIDYCMNVCESMDWLFSVERYRDENCWDMHIRHQVGKSNFALPLIRSYTQNEAGDKVVHPVFKFGSRDTRLKVLAGLIDTDGYMHHGHYEISTKFDSLAADILFLARSLGYAAYDNYGQKTCANTGATGMYHRITISGDFCDLPVLCERSKIKERKQKKDVTHVGIEVEELPEGDYCGFVIDGDHRFLLGDFTITHNTAISVQYACAQALMGNTTVWATYEQSLEGDIAERIISYVTDESLDNIRDVGFENLPEDVQRRFWASVAGTDDRLVVLDMTRKKHVTEEDPQDYGGIWSVWKEVKRLKAEGKKVRTVLIDWVGAMMQRVAANSGKDIANKFRFHTEHELMVAKEMVKKEDVQVIFFHQVDSKTAHAKPTYLPDMTCAKDMHDLSNYMDIVMILGRRDKNNVCYMNCDKSRKGAAVTRTIQLIGDKARFVAANGWIPDRDGNFYKPSDSYMPEDPDDARSDVNTIFSREVD